MGYGPSYGPYGHFCGSATTDITPPSFGLNITPAAGAKTTCEDPTPDCIVIIHDAVLDLSLEDHGDVEGLFQISKALVRPYKSYTFKVVERLTKNKGQEHQREICYMTLYPKVQEEISNNSVVH